MLQMFIAAAARMHHTTLLQVSGQCLISPTIASPADKYSVQAAIFAKGRHQLHSHGIPMKQVSDVQNERLDGTNAR
jgi:hypothetical protein